MAQLLFWTMFAGLVWAFAGYPAAMMVMAAVRPRRVVAGEHDASVSVLLPVRNEAGRVEARIRDLKAQNFPQHRLEIIVICNGCTDATEEEARRIAAEVQGVRVIVSPGHEGKSGALNAGASAAKGEVLVLADARQMFHADAIQRLVNTFADASVGACSGRLVIARSDRPGVRGVGLYWEMETALRLAEARTGSTVGVTGAIYAVRRDLFPIIPPDLILDDLLVPMEVTRRGKRVVLEPEAIAFDTPAPEASSEYRRKLRTLSGNVQILRIAPWLLSPHRNPIFVRYVSHKVLRLAAPVFCLGMLLAGWGTPGLPYRAAVFALLAVYAAGLLGLWIRVPVFSIPSAFVLVQVAGLAALVRPTRRASDVWRR